MQIYKKYLLKLLLKPFLISLVTLIIIIWSTRIIKYMNILSQSGVRFIDFFRLVLCTLPSVLLVVLPLIVIFTTVLTYNGLSQNRELIVLQNCGVNKIQLAFPLIVLSVIITCVAYCVSVGFVHKSNLLLRERRRKIQNNISVSMIREGVFTKFKDMVIYVGKRHKNIARNVILYKGAKDYDILIQAQEATIYDNVINLHNGNLQKNIYHDADSDQYEQNILFFDEYDLNLNILTSDSGTLSIKPDSMPTTQLIGLLKDKNSQFDTNRVIYELNYRLFFPITSILMSLLCSALILSSEFNKVSNTKGIATSSCVTTAIYIVMLLICKKVTQSANYLYALYTVAAIVLLVSVVLFRERDKFLVET